MRTISATIAVLMLAAVPLYAQVIEGESTYEDNFLHQPPHQAAAAAAQSRPTAETPQPSDMRRSSGRE